ncbi:MAG TPA: shikimate dehydrogenase [Moheibacter sp.]|nr:shikimate dehydrogenase [Moheibacter sp.]
MRNFGLIGQAISYSFSATFFAEKFQRENIDDAQYQTYDLDNLDEINALISLENLRGFNVTIPFKEQIIPYLDALSKETQVVGAVNCVKIVDGKKTGYNTDVYGFQKSLESFLGELRPNALVLGNGGAAKAVAFVLEQMNIHFKIVTRKGDFRYENLDETTLLKYPLLINCTPLGTFPNVEEKPPIPYEFLNEQYFLFDLVYNPEKSAFLQSGEEKGAKIQNGYPMLVFQAEKSWEIWNEF